MSQHDRKAPRQSMDWKALEARLVDTARATPEHWLAQGAGPLYAAAFHASHREEEHVLGLPSLAANSLAALAADHPRWKEEGFVGIKWNPADWRWAREPDDPGGRAARRARRRRPHGGPPRGPGAGVTHPLKRRLD